MKHFIIKSVAFLTVVLLCIIVIFYVLNAKDWSDAYYKRFLSKEKSLIIGSSRAAQGILPCVIDYNLFDCNFSLPIYNYSFDCMGSPYGRVYYESIEKKLERSDCGRALFIVAVDPMSLSVEDVLDSDGYREDDFMVSRTHFICTPNIEYMLRYCRPKEWRPSKNQQLHDDGWLEISTSMDSASVAQGIKRKMDDYNSYHITPSDYRISWLGETVALLKDNGTVFLCRIPVGSEMSEWENNMWPTFDDDMYELAKSWNVTYFPFAETRNSYRTTDGNHLYKEDGRKFTRDLCDSIKMRPIVMNGQVY